MPRQTKKKKTNRAQTATTAKAARSSASKASVSGGASKATSESAQDAIALLKADHRKVEQIFQEFENSEDDDEKHALAEQACHELIVHAMIEEEIFYPACREHLEEEDPLNEAQVEHDGAKILINEILSGSTSDLFFDAKVKVLSEYIKHHVKEEEQPGKGIFAKAKAAGVDMEELGRRLKKRKEQLLPQVESGRLNHPRPKSIDVGEIARVAASQPDRARRERSFPDDDRSPPTRSRNRYEGDDRRGYRSGRQEEDRGRSYGDSEDRPRYNDERPADRRYGARRDQYGYSTSEGDHDRRGYQSNTPYRDQDDRDRPRPRRDEDDDDRSRGGLFGDHDAHSEAARRGWRDRR